MFIPSLRSYPSVTNQITPIHNSSHSNLAKSVLFVAARTKHCSHHKTLHCVAKSKNALNSLASSDLVLILIFPLCTDFFPDSRLVQSRIEIAYTSVLISRPICTVEIPVAHRLHLRFTATISFHPFDRQCGVLIRCVDVGHILAHYLVILASLRCFGSPFAHFVLISALTTYLAMPVFILCTSLFLNTLLYDLPLFFLLYRQPGLITTLSATVAIGLYSSSLDRSIKSRLNTRIVRITALPVRWFFCTRCAPELHFSVPVFRIFLSVTFFIPISLLEMVLSITEKLHRADIKMIGDVLEV